VVGLELLASQKMEMQHLRLQPWLVVVENDGEYLADSLWNPPSDQRLLRGPDR
jgi:hypothetical protein